MENITTEKSELTKKLNNYKKIYYKKKYHEDPVFKLNKQIKCKKYYVRKTKNCEKCSCRIPINNDLKICESCSTVKKIKKDINLKKDIKE